MPGLEITVGPVAANLLGSDRFALQSAVDYIAAHGGGIWIEGMSPFYKNRNQIAKRTVVSIEGNVIRLHKVLRDDYWLEPGANASTPFPVIIADYVNDATVESLAIDGDRSGYPAGPIARGGAH